MERQIAHSPAGLKQLPRRISGPRPESLILSRRPASNRCEAPKSGPQAPASASEAAALLTEVTFSVPEAVPLLTEAVASVPKVVTSARQAVTSLAEAVTSLTKAVNFFMEVPTFKRTVGRPLLLATKPELREYKCVYVQNDAEIGLFSDEVVVNCAPWTMPGQFRAMRKKKRVKLPRRLEMQVFQEAGARCVFCDQTEIVSLQIHHIDGDPSNNSIENLILSCATCHAKITTGVISEDEVLRKKRQIAESGGNAKGKYRPELYDKRFVAYQETQDFLNKAIGDAKTEDFAKFAHTMDAADSLFESDIHDLLRSIRNKANRAATAAAEAKRMPASAQHAALCDMEGNIKQDLLAELSRLKDVFGPYLRQTA